MYNAYVSKRILTNSQISSRSLVSLTLSLVSPSSYASSNIPRLASALETELSHITERVTFYISGLPFLPPLDSSSYTEVPSLAHVCNCLRLLDGCLLGQWGSSEKDSNERELLASEHDAGLQEVLASLCIATDVLSRQEDRYNIRDIGGFSVRLVTNSLVNDT